MPGALAGCGEAENELPRVTIALPVHNGGSDIRRCLANLAASSYPNFGVDIFENASTDGTAEFVSTFCAADPRFRVFPVRELLSASQNFARAIRTSVGHGTYFCLRAADDWTSTDFIEELVQTLEANPGKSLAVPEVVFANRDGSQFIDARYENAYRALDLDGRRNFPAKFPASWYYGLYRVGPATDFLARAGEVFPYEWGQDRLVVYKCLTDLGVVCSRKVKFYCQTGSGSEMKYKHATLADAARRRHAYFRACIDMQHYHSIKGIVARIAEAVRLWQLAGRHTETTVKHCLKS